MSSPTQPRDPAFPQVDLVDTFVLPARASRTVIVSYRSQQQQPQGSAGAAERDGDAMRRDEHTQRSSQSRHAIVEERATLKLRYMPCSEREVHLSAGIDAAAALTAATAAYARAASVAAQQLTIKLIAKRCRSVLRTDVQELVFENCVIGSSSVKDFTVWNCSEVRQDRAACRCALSPVACCRALTHSVERTIRRLAVCTRRREALRWPCARSPCPPACRFDACVTLVSTIQWHHLPPAT